MIDDDIVALMDIPEDDGAIPTLDEQLRTALLRRNAADVLPVLDFRKTATLIPFVRANAMRHVRQLREKSPTQGKPMHEKQAILASWVGDVLCAMYETKRSITIEALVCSQLTSQPLNAFQAAAIIRVWERDAALDCIDSLWSDFLQDVAVLQAASQGRAFSMFDPVDEFRLESAKAFSTLLRRHSAILSSRLLGSVGVAHVRYLEAGSNVAESAMRIQNDANIDFVLGLESAP